MTFSVPTEDRYFEDYIDGSVHEFGPITISQEEIIDFAQQFDPQELHLNPEGAKNGAYGGLIASGWHTASLMMRLYVEHYLSHVASLGSPGVDELRWIIPVRPGDELSLRVTVSETRKSRSKPDRGILHSDIEMINQNREAVMRMKAMNIVLCRQKF